MGREGRKGRVAFFSFLHSPPPSPSFNISVSPTEITGPVKVDHLQKAGPEYSGLKWSVPFDVPFLMFTVEMVEASNSIFGQNHQKKKG